MDYCPHCRKQIRPRAFLEELSGHQGEECVLWPFRAHLQAGYGAVSVNGEAHGAHRLMCIIEYGEPEGDRRYAAHSCGNPQCVNPRHLRWATQAENMEDRKLHGTFISGEAVPSSKLTSAKVRMIRFMVAKGVQQQRVARTFKVSESTVSGIVRGRHWWHDPESFPMLEAGAFGG